MRILSVSYPKNALLTTCKLFIDHILTMVRFYMINEKINKLEKGQYRACLATTGAMQGTSSQKLYNKLGLHSVRKRRWPSKQIFCIKY